MENTNRGRLHRTVLLEWITIIGALLTCFGILYSEIRGLDAKIDRNTEMQSARSDRLYEMFIDLLKETKCHKHASRVDDFGFIAFDEANQS